MDLRAPPSHLSASNRAPRLATLALLQLLTLAALAVLLVVLLHGRRPGLGVDAGRLRELGGKLKAAGAVNEAAAAYERLLDSGAVLGETRAQLALGLATLFYEQGAYEKALRWLYEAQAEGGELRGEVNTKIVACLERLGRVHAARAALAGATDLSAAGPNNRPADDPVVAQIGAQKIFRSDVQRALDDLPPELAKQFATPAQRQTFLRKYVGDELLARKAQKLEYDRDPEVRRRLENVYRQLVISAFVDREMLGKIQPNETDLRNHFAAHRDRFAPPTDGSKSAGKPEPTFEQARRQVEQDYRMSRLQTAYEEQIQSELAAEAVQFFPERLEAGP